MEVVNILDIDGTQWEIRDEEARKKISVLETSFNSLTDYKKDKEINTGTKWIDGKAIYRKVFFSNINWINGETIGSIKDHDTITKINSLSQLNDGRWFQNYTTNENQNTATVFQNGNVVAYRTGDFQNNKKAFVLIEYTKTKD